MKAPQLAERVHAGQGHNHCQVSIDGYDGFYTDACSGVGLLQFTDSAIELVLRVELRGDRFVFTGSPTGEHSIAADVTITNVQRLLAHWQGYVDNARAATEMAS